MALFRTAEPALEPVTIADARSWLRVSHTSEDQLIGSLISAARQDVESQTGLSLIHQEWRLTFDNWPNSNIIELPRGPVAAVIAVTVYAADGTPSVLPPASYLLDMRSEPARLMFESHITPGQRLNGIEIDFSSGFGPTGTSVPDILKRAILLLVAHWYEFRGAFRASDQPVSYPDSYLPLLRPFKKVRL